MAVADPEPAGAQSPHSESIEALFQALESPLLNYAFRLLPHADMAEDVVQEAFTRLHAQFDRVREPRRWLYRTVHNLALNHQRDTAKIVPLEPMKTVEGAPANEPVDPKILPDEQVARWEGIGLVRLGLQHLDPRSREVVQLKFNDALSYKEISARTGLGVGHVGYLLHHAIKSLAADLAKAGLIP